MLPGLHELQLTASQHALTERASAGIHHLTTKYLVTPTDVLIAWLSLHTHLAYLILFAGAFFEALVGPSFFVPGELFILSGSILAGLGRLNIWLVTAALFAGAVLGDTSSYFIGRRIGLSIFHDRKRVLNFKNYRKAEALLEKYGPSALFFARFIGPFSKLAPVTAGVFGITPRIFFLYNILGIIVALGQAIFVGYYFGTKYELVFFVIERYFLIGLVALATALLLYWYFKKGHKPRNPTEVAPPAGGK